MGVGDVGVVPRVREQWGEGDEFVEYKSRVPNIRVEYGPFIR